MDTIRNYLENLFSSLPKTQQVLNAKQQLLESMNDKYDELKAQGKSENEAIGIVISEFGNIDELKAELNIAATADIPNGLPVIEADYVDEYITKSSKSNKLISLGVALCVTSPIGLIIGAGFNNIIPGMIMLFLFIAVAVAIFIFSGTTVEQYEYLKKGEFVLSGEASKLVNDYRNKNASKRTGGLIFGVLMCILSAVPLIVYALTCPEAEAEMTLFQQNLILILVGVLLLMVAIGVLVIIIAGTSDEVSKVLLKKEEYAPENKQGNKIIDIISSIYWPIIVVAYLAWSFVTEDWHISWVIWPLAGILFGAIAAITRAVTNTNERY